WQFLEAGVNLVMVDLHRGLDMAAYMQLYTAVHNFCTSQKIGAPASSPVGVPSRMGRIG
ncbi:hypothetical protein KEM55_006912, partial [Ascosphaera atra]